MTDCVRQVEASLHIAIRYNHEPLHSEVVCVQEQAFHEVSSVVLLRMRFLYHKLIRALFPRSKPKSLFSKMESSKSTSESSMRSDENKDVMVKKS